MSDLPCYRVDKDDKSFCQLRKFHRGPCDFSRSKPKPEIQGRTVELKVKISFEDLKKAYEAALAAAEEG